MYTVDNNMKLVGHVLNKYFNGGNDFENLGFTKDDLFQIGCIGLINASKRFDESLGFQFSTYAIKYIVGEIYKELTSKSSLIRFPKDIKSISREIIADDLYYSLSEIREKYNLTKYKAGLVLECINNYNLKSLDEAVLNGDESGNKITLADVIPSNDEYAFYNTKQELEERLSILNKREKEIIILALEKNNQTYIAEQLGLSQVTISRYIRSAIEKINKHFKPVGVMN